MVCTIAELLLCDLRSGISREGLDPVTIGRILHIEMPLCSCRLCKSKTQRNLTIYPHSLRTWRNSWNVDKAFSLRDTRNAGSCYLEACCLGPRNPNLAIFTEGYCPLVCHKQILTKYCEFRRCAHFIHYYIQSVKICVFMGYHAPRAYITWCLQEGKYMHLCTRLPFPDGGNTWNLSYNFCRSKNIVSTLFAAMFWLSKV